MIPLFHAASMQTAILMMIPTQFKASYLVSLQMLLWPASLPSLDAEINLGTSIDMTQYLKPNSQYIKLEVPKKKNMQIVSIIACASAWFLW